MSKINTTYFYDFKRAKSKASAGNFQHSSYDLTGATKPRRNTILNASDLTIQDPLGAFCSHSEVRIQGAPQGLLAGTRFGVKDLYHFSSVPTFSQQGFVS
jgi:hypothetical protein